VTLNNFEILFFAIIYLAYLQAISGSYYIHDDSSNKSGVVENSDF